VSETNVQNAVQSAGNALQRAYARPSAEANKLGKDDFLKLLMAQVTHQDPLNPTDSAGMMQQLTGMSSLEQLVSLNESMTRLHETQGDVVRASVFSFLDKDVTVRGGGVPVTRGQAPGLQFTLPREAETVRIAIADANGQPVRELELGAQGPGTHAVEWDARDAAGQPVPDGFYRYRVAAESADSEPVPADLYVQGKVAGIRFEKGRPLLTVNGEDVDAREILELSNRSQRLFGDQLPPALRSELRPGDPATRRRP
jgi:flagellar basal-body rod modification protein FlgD